MIPVTVYIAGCSKELARVEHVYNQLMFATLNDEADIEVLHRWWDEVKEVGTANPEFASEADRYKWSLTDLEAVEEADILLLLIPEEPGTAGAYVELGVAYGARKEIVCAGSRAALNRSIFHSLGSKFESDEAAINYVIECSQGKYTVGPDYTCL